VFKRKTEGSVLCTSCGVLVGVNDETCYNCGRRNPSLWGFAPALRALGGDLGFVPFVIGACAVIYGLTLIYSGPEIRMSGVFGFLGPSNFAVVVFGASGAVPVFRFDRWWSVLSAGWLHAGLLHITLNMLAVRQLAPAVAELYGAGRTVIVYVVAGACGFLASSIAGLLLPGVPFIGGGQITLGASAPIAGLIGALLYYGHRSGSGSVKSYATQSILMMLLYGFMLPGIDNWAHAGGAAGGYLASRVLDPLKPERVDHMVIAVVCLAISLLAVVASFITAHFEI
jgi:membrane associated rhomboid family serine protease